MSDEKFGTNDQMQENIFNNTDNLKPTHPVPSMPQPDQPEQSQPEPPQFEMADPGEPVEDAASNPMDSADSINFVETQEESMPQPEGFFEKEPTEETSDFYSVQYPNTVQNRNNPTSGYGNAGNGNTHYDTQRLWQAQGFQNGEGNNSYYKESYKNTKGKSNAWKYVLVSILSSIIGGAFVTVMLLVVAPAIQPELKSILQEAFPNSNIDYAPPSIGEYKKVEIVQTGESAITSVAEKVGPSVVGIRTTYQSSNSLFGIQPQGGEGSGIIYSTDGYIITNHHVIEGAINDKTRSISSGAKIQVYLPNRIDKPYTATLKGYDSKTDLAVLKIEETNLPAIELGNSDEIKVGEPAIAVGNPGGLEYMGSVTSGVISGLNRTVQLEGGKKIQLVQTDAAINPGNSGGALVNIKGQLIGVNTVKMVATGFEGLGFAIPVNDVRNIIEQLVENSYIPKPYLGIFVDQRYTEELAKANNMPAGVYVSDTEMLGPAQKAGILQGDVVTKFNGKTIKTFDELEAEKGKFKPGDTVTLEVYRQGETKSLQITLGETK